MSKVRIAKVHRDISCVLRSACNRGKSIDLTQKQAAADSYNSQQSNNLSQTVDFLPSWLEVTRTVRLRRATVILFSSPSFNRLIF